MRHSLCPVFIAKSIIVYNGDFKKENPELSTKTTPIGMANFLICLCNHFKNKMCGVGGILCKFFSCSVFLILVEHLLFILCKLLLQLR